jgi:hypothetical protein
MATEIAATCHKTYCEDSQRTHSMWQLSPAAITGKDIYIYIYIYDMQLFVSNAVSIPAHSMDIHGKRYVTLNCLYTTAINCNTMSDGLALWLARQLFAEWHVVQRGTLPMNLHCY